MPIAIKTCGFVNIDVVKVVDDAELLHLEGFSLFPYFCSSERLP